MRALERIKPWLLAARPKTLTAAFVPVMVGTALAQAMGHSVIWIMTIYALLATFFIQVATNLFNDAIDFKKGADTEKRQGPMRVTQSGLVSYRTVMWGGFFFSLLAFFCGIPLALHGGWPIVLIGVLSLALGYLYTGGPYPLAYVGLGDLFVILFFGLIAVGGVYYLHTFLFSIEALIAGLQIGLLATSLIVINNMRDIDQDRQVGKRTLAVLLGLHGSRIEILFLYLICFCLQIFWFSKFWWLAGVLPLLSLPLVFRLIVQIFKTPPSPYLNKLLAQSALIHLLFGALLFVGLWKI